MMTMDGVLRIMRPFTNRLANMVARVVVNLVDDSTKMQTLQVDVLSEETREGVERVQNYGFTSVPLPGAEGVAVFVAGRRDHGLIIAVDDRRYRLTGLEGGEVAMHDDLGSSILIKRNGDVEITPQSGVVTVIGDVRADGISLKDHTHAAGSYAAGGDPVTGSSGAAS